MPRARSAVAETRTAAAAAAGSGDGSDGGRAGDAAARPLRAIDLFSGVGGISVALAGLAEPVAFCEQDEYAVHVLLSRMRDGSLPRARVFSDVNALSAGVLGVEAGEIELVYGGFPCQDVSAANSRGEGTKGQRSGLFRRMVHLGATLKARYMFFENVDSIRARGLSAVVSTLHKAGYDCVWTTVSAFEVGAPHRRMRWFCLARARSESALRPRAALAGEAARVAPAARVVSVGGGDWEEADAAASAGAPGAGSAAAAAAAEGDVGGVCDPSGGGGLAGAVAACARASCFTASREACVLPRTVPYCEFQAERLAALGNAVVPLQVRFAFSTLWEAIHGGGLARGSGGTRREAARALPTLSAGGADSEADTLERDVATWAREAAEPFLAPATDADDWQALSAMDDSSWPSCGACLSGVVRYVADVESPTLIDERTNVAGWTTERLWPTPTKQLRATEVSVSRRRCPACAG